MSIIIALECLLYCSIS